jgi:ribosomal protein S13
MNANTRTTPLIVHASQARTLVAALREAGIEDQESLEISLESETGIGEAVAERMAAVALRKAHIAGLEKLKEEIGARKLRLEQEIERIEGAVTDAILRVGHNIPTPLGTAYVSAGRRSCRIITPELIPDEFVEVVTERKIRKADLTRALQAGRIVEGAELSNGRPSLGLRS